MTNANSHQTEKYYDKLAGVYDSATEKGCWTPPDVVADLLSGVLKDGDDVIDIGIGTGQSIAAAVESGKCSRIVGVDLSAEMLAHCSKKYPNVQLHQGDIYSFAKDAKPQFDVVICCGMFEFVSNSQEFLKAVNRISKSTASIILTYEPLVLFHELQSEAKSATSPSNASWAVDGFTTYRHSPTDISRMLKIARLRILKDVEFVSYRKVVELPEDTQTVNVIYHGLLVGKIS